MSKMKTLAVVIADDYRRADSSALSQERARAALPFAGKYRIIDFALSNCANSGILTIGIAVQHNPCSLSDHVRAGQPWDLDRSFSGGVTLLQPYQRKVDSLEWYRGTADAIYQNLDFILDRGADTLLVSSSDCVHQMDYTSLLHHHRQSQADATICAVDGPVENASWSGTLTTDSNGRVMASPEGAFEPLNTLASIDVYAFQTDALAERLAEDAQLPDSDHDLGKDVLPRMLAMGDRIYAYRFAGYWADVSTVQAYWEANMALLAPDRLLNLSDSQWNIHTRGEKRPPTNIFPGAAVFNSLISDGCVIEGQVENSVLSPGVRIGANAVVRDSVVLNDCQVGAGAVVERAVLDENVIVGLGSYIGFGLDYAPDHRQLGHINNNLTFVGPNTHLPAGLWVSRECVIDGDLGEDDFSVDLIVSSRHADLQLHNSVFIDPQCVLATAPALC
jgi:glucose-1-phosphate adenylyltransferase